MFAVKFPSVPFFFVVLVLVWFDVRCAVFFCELDLSFFPHVALPAAAVKCCAGSKTKNM